MVADVNATLTATQNNTDTITEIVCRASSQHDAEQLAHAASADDSAPRRTLNQDLSLTGLTDATVETLPDVVQTSVDTPQALHNLIDEDTQNNIADCSAAASSGLLRLPVQTASHNGGLTAACGSNAGASPNAYGKTHATATSNDTDNTEQQAQEAVVDDSVPPRMLYQAVASPSLVDATADTSPDAVKSYVDASPPLHDPIDGVDKTHTVSCSNFDNLTTDNAGT